ncbi:serine hydrolase domain-containing protein [Labrys okinawensis]|uniref:serine hydrolase domain-containing protein n=1 Tax=Labrys okinawensis TaxID=346911 RepID=UPI0039BCFEEE
MTAMAFVIDASPLLAASKCPVDPAAFEQDLDVQPPGAAALHSISLRDAMRVLPVPSFSIALIVGDRVALAKAYGDATPDTLYQAASLSKIVTAVAALRLVQESKLNLDQDINDELISWKLPQSDLTTGHPVTLRGLLTMTAGIGVPGYGGYERGSPSPTTVQILEGEAPATSPPVRVETVPGTAYAYSGGGYQIVQKLIEDATRQSFADAVRSLVLAPAGMTRSVYELPGALAPKGVAEGHSKNGQALPGGWRQVPELAAGGLWSNPTDLAHLLISLSRSYQGKEKGILSRPIARSMMTRNAIGPYGLGAAIEGAGPDVALMKRGQNVGYQAYMLIFPETGDGLVVMTGSDNGTALETAFIRRAAQVCNWPALATLPD